MNDEEILERVIAETHTNNKKYVERMWTAFYRAITLAREDEQKNRRMSLADAREYADTMKNATTKNTVRFKSYPLYFIPERDGLKCNTIRKVDMEDERFIRLLTTGDVEFITIENTATKEEFTRKITNLCEWRDTNEGDSGYPFGKDLIISFENENLRKENEELKKRVEKLGEKLGNCMCNAMKFQTSMWDEEIKNKELKAETERLKENEKRYKKIH